jgi:hypothetical protein
VPRLDRLYQLGRKRDIAIAALLDLVSASDRVSKYANIRGFREPRSNNIRYIIKCDAFNSLFESVHDRDLTLGWLTRHRWITLAIPTAAPASSKPRPKNQHEWPDGRRRRSCEIRVPRRSRKKEESAG